MQAHFSFVCAGLLATAAAIGCQFSTLTPDQQSVAYRGSGRIEIDYRGSGRIDEVAYRGSGRIELSYRGSGRIEVA
jgi:hypothetical protein